MYRIQALILNIQQIRDSQTRIILLSEEYGKISVWWYKKNISGIDLGDIVEVIVSRSSSKNIIHEIRTQYSAWNKSWNYATIHSFLDTLKIISSITVEWMEYRWIYQDAKELIQSIQTKDLSLSHYVIFQMRMLKRIGSMDSQGFTDEPILHYIYENISKTPLEKIFSSQKFRDGDIEKIQKANWQSLYLLND